MKDKELKPCPCCGSEPLTMRMSKRCVIGCPDCEIEISGWTTEANTTCKIEKVRLNLIDKRNTRASDKLTQEIYNLMSKSWQLGFDREGEKVIPNYIKTLLDVIERKDGEIEQTAEKIHEILLDGYDTKSKLDSFNFLRENLLDKLNKE